MELFLSILKLSGIIVSGSLGILGTVTETRSKKTGRLTPWGKWALILTIAGFATALLAQITDSIYEYNKSRASQVRTEEQLQLARNSLKQIEAQGLLAQTTLDHIQRVVMRFESLEVIVKFEIPASAFQLSDLISEASRSNYTNVMSSPDKDFTAVQASTQDPLEAPTTNMMSPEGIEMLALCVLTTRS